MKPRYEHYDLCICGGGVAGLATALGVASTGKRILIVEKAARINPNGADVLKPAGIKVLQDLGILQQLVRSEARKRHQVRIFHNGDLINVMDYRRDNALPYFYLVPYAVVVRTILEQLKTYDQVEILLETALTDIVQDSNGDIQSLVFNDQDQVTADVVIGADGGNSKLRNLLGIEVEKKYYSQAMYFNQFPLVNSVDDMNRLYVDEDFGLAYFYPVSYSSFRAVLGFPRAEGDAYFKNGSLSALKSRLRQFVTESEDAIRAIDSLDGFVTFPLYRMNMDAYNAGNAAFIGNAAHAIHPITGQGMNLAIEDSGELSAQLKAYFNGTQSVYQALENYSNNRHYINEKVVGYGDNLATNFNQQSTFTTKLDLRIQTSGRQLEVLDSV